MVKNIGKSSGRRHTLFMSTSQRTETEQRQEYETTTRPECEARESEQSEASSII